MGASARELFENCEGNASEDLKQIHDAVTEEIGCVAAGGSRIRCVKTPGWSAMCGEPVIEARWRRWPGGKTQLVEGDFAWSPLER
jgi:hypothetical protein